MIKTIPIDHILSYLIGTIFVLSSMDRVKQEGLFTSRVFLHGFLYQIFIFLPIGFYLVIRWPDWSWMYLFDNRNFPLAMRYIAVGSYIISFLIGYILTVLLIKKDKAYITYILTVIAVISCIILFIIPRENLYYVGTFEQFVEKRAEPFFKNTDFVLSFIAIGLYFFVPLIILLRRNIKLNH